MKIPRAKKRVLPEPLLKPKRLDLNEAQLLLQRQVSELPLESLIFMEGDIHRVLPEGTLKTHFHRKGLVYYRPSEIRLALGLSKQSLEKYVDGYLRLVRLRGETPREFQARKAQSYPDAPLAKEFPEEFRESGDFRFVSSRILIFLVMAPTQVRGDKPYLTQLREVLSGSSHLRAGRPLPIHKNSGVTTWKLST